MTARRRRSSSAWRRLPLTALALAISLCALAGTAAATPTFLSAVNLSDAGQDGFEPQVAVDTNGNILTVWTRSDGTNLRIQALMRGPDGSFGPVETISDAGVNASQPQVAFDGSGNAIAVWSQSQGANTRIQSAFRPSGGSFGSPLVLSVAGGSADRPEISIDSNGKAVAVWERYDGANLRIQASVRPSGGSFGAVQTLSDPGQDGFTPKVAAGPNADANAAAVWTRSDGTKLRVQSSRRRDVAGFVRPKGATPLRVPLVIAYAPCTSGNRTHALPLGSPSCSSPIQSSSVLTVGTPDANGFTANSIASVRFDSILGDLNNNVDDSDVKLTVSMSDIRNNPSGTDYTGQVLMAANLQITDTNNDPETPNPATAQTLALQAPVNCSATGDANIGGSCSFSSTLDAIVPGTVVEGKRSIWELGQIEVKDAGPNGTGYAGCPPTCGDGDETVFMRQGIFVP